MQKPCWLRWIVLGMALSALFLSAWPHSAHADVVGRLRLHVVNAGDHHPLPNVTLILQDSAHIRPTQSLTTDAHGATFSAPLENRAWELIAATEKETPAPAAPRHGRTTGKGISLDLHSLAPERRAVIVTADTTTDVTLLVDTDAHKVSGIVGTNNLVRVGDTGNSYRRDRDFITRYPVTAGNPQSLNGVLHTGPGVGAAPQR